MPLLTALLAAGDGAVTAGVHLDPGPVKPRTVVRRHHVRHHVRPLLFARRTEPDRKYYRKYICK